MTLWKAKVSYSMHYYRIDRQGVFTFRHVIIGVLALIICFAWPVNAMALEHNAGLEHLRNALGRTAQRMHDVSTRLSVSIPPIVETVTRKAAQGIPLTRDEIDRGKKYLQQVAAKKGKSTQDIDFSFSYGNVCATALAVATGDLEPMRRYAATLDRMPFAFALVIYDDKAALATAQSLSPEWTDALCEYLIHNMTRHLEDRFLSPHKQYSDFIRYPQLRLLGHMPVTEMSKYFILHYPFQAARKFKYQMPSPDLVMKSLLDAVKGNGDPPNQPIHVKNQRYIFQWYVDEVIRPAGLEEEFSNFASHRHVSDEFSSILKDTETVSGGQEKGSAGGDDGV